MEEEIDDYYISEQASIYEVSVDPNTNGNFIRYYLVLN